MKLYQLTESTNLLDQIATFKVVLWPDPQMPKKEIVNNFTAFFAKDPPPGITSVKARVIRVDWDSMGEDGLLDVYVRMTIENYIRNSVEYDNDPYSILQNVKEAAGTASAEAAHKFMQTASDLKVARIGMSDGEMSSDSWPTKPNL